MKDILTGKAKEDFISWYETAYFEYASCITHYQASIIEWFDTVGIYINVTPMYLDHKDKYSQGLFYSAICFKDGTPTACVDYDKINPKLDRKEATEYAIKKANEIYNESKH